MKLLHQTLQEIRPIDPHWIDSASKRQLELTKPPGSLGRLEDIANRCAAIRESFELTASRPRIVLFAADHGVCAEGVSAYPQEVTAQMVLNFLHGGAAINAFARAGGIELKVVDIGVATPLPLSSDLISRRVAPGTRNFCEAPAMTETEMTAALETGIELAADAAMAGCDLTRLRRNGHRKHHVRQRHRGRSNRRTDRRCRRHSAPAPMRHAWHASVPPSSAALTLHAESLATPLGVLRCVGGLEIAAMCGFCLGACRPPRACCHRWLHRHRRRRAGSPPLSRLIRLSVRVPSLGRARHTHLLTRHPVKSRCSILGMRLGEGTGAALAMKLIQASIAAFTGMATFTSAGVSNK